jgi:hypothetical protein
MRTFIFVSVAGIYFRSEWELEPPNKARLLALWDGSGLDVLSLQSTPYTEMTAKGIEVQTGAKDLDSLAEGLAFGGEVKTPELVQKNLIALLESSGYLQVHTR